MKEHAEETLGHVIRGHDNAQSVIRFLDEKNAFIVGLSTAFAGVALYIVAKVFGPEAEGFRVPVTAVSLGHLIALVVVLVSLALAVGCIVCTALSVTAACPPPNRSVEHSVLFPFHECEKAWSARSYYMEALRKGMAPDLIMCEYADQMAILGGIIHNKRRFHRHSVLLFTLQSSTLLIGVALGLATTSWV